MRWTFETIISATGGTVIGRSDWISQRVSHDSRHTNTGDLFIALMGLNFDGHNFVSDASSKGAVAAIVSRIPGENNDMSFPLVLVSDTLVALHDMAKYVRKNCENTVFIGITGSCGKTTTKDMLGLTLAQYGPTHVTWSSFNNHIGFPLTLLNMPCDTRFAVIELGMNHAGEIERLSDILQPDIALITNIHPAHIGNFSNIRDIADAKAEIFGHLLKNGIAVLNHDDEFYDYLCNQVGENKRLVSFGSNAKATIRLVRRKTLPMLIDRCHETIVEVEVQRERLEYKLSVAGDHITFDSLAVIAVLHALGLEIALGSRALASYVSYKGRGNIHQHITICDNVRVTVIDDTFNSNPGSLSASLKLLGEYEHSGRKVAVLGDMGELGVFTQKMHEDISVDVCKNGLDVVYAIGENMLYLYNALPPSFQRQHFTSPDEFIDRIRGLFKHNDLVLVKSSHAVQTDKIVSFLTQT